MKIFPATQIPLVERTDLTPLYFAHIYLPGETLYFSDRNFKFNGHDYEAYLLDIPETIHSIERFGGYLNINAQLTFRNARFRTYARLFDFFIVYPLAKKEMDLFVLYLNDGAIPITDVSTKLHKVSFGEFKGIQTETFEVELFSILYALDQKKLFTQINRANWPNASPTDIGKFENRCIGAIKDVPCHCVDTGAVSTLAADVVANAATIYLTEVDYPLPFPSSGSVQIGIGYVTYTGKNSATKALTGCSWLIPARNHNRGDPVWENKSSYKFLVDTAIVKSASNVKAAGVAVADADRTVVLNDGGKTTISFTQRNLLRNQGAHSHGGMIIEKFNPTGASFTYSAGMGAAGSAAYLMDGNQATFCHVGVTGTTDSGKTADFTVTFPAYYGAIPDRVYACIVCDDSLGFERGEYFNITVPQSIQIGTQSYSQGKFTFRALLAGTSIPGTLTVEAHTNQGTPTYPCLLIANVYEMWLELEFDNIPSGGESAVWSVLAPLVTCDVEGYPDNASGDYTGVANALIQNPADCLKYFLAGIMGRSISEIDASFTTVRTLMANRIPGGYKIGGVLSKMGANPSDIVRTINEQSRSQLREDGGKWVLDFHESPIITFGASDVLPPGGAGITASSVWSSTAAQSCDDNGSTFWWASVSFVEAWVQVDWGAGVNKIINTLTITPLFLATGRVKDFVLEGSNDGVKFTTLYTGIHANNATKETYSFICIQAFRYHRLRVTSNWDPAYGVAITEWELFETSFVPSSPSSAMTIDKNIFIGDPVFSMTPASEIKNLIRAVYELDYGNNGDRRKYGDYFNQFEAPDGVSIGVYGELPEEIAYSWISDPYMALDAAMWRLVQRKGGIPMVDLVCNRRVRALERGDHFTLNDSPIAAWEATLWRILQIGETPDRQQFKISGIKYIGS